MSVMLQKKMVELEEELSEVYRHPISADLRRQISFDDVDQRFSFLAKVLAAELESQPQNSDELQQISEKLSQMKTTFRDWNKSRTCIFDNTDIDNLPICSDCTQTLYDVHKDVVESSRDESSSEAEEFHWPEKVLTDEKGLKERKWRQIGKYCGVFGCGMMVGAVIVSMIISVNLIKDVHVMPHPT